MIICLSGFRGSGKNEVAKILCKKYNFEMYSLSTKLKDIISVLFNWDRKLIEGDTFQSREFRTQIDNYWTNKLGFDVTPEKMFTLIGTDLFRNELNFNFWIYVLEKNILDNIEKNIVIDRVSYPNEMEFIKNLGGISVLVDRQNPLWYNEWINLNDKIDIEKYMKCKNVHDSEYSLLNYKFDYIIENKLDLRVLENNVDNLMGLINDRSNTR